MAALVVSGQEVAGWTMAVIVWWKSGTPPESVPGEMCDRGSRGNGERNRDFLPLFIECLVWLRDTQQSAHRWRPLRDSQTARLRRGVAIRCSGWAELEPIELPRHVGVLPVFGNFEGHVFQESGYHAFRFQRVAIPGAPPTRPIVHARVAGREQRNEA